MGVFAVDFRARARNWWGFRGCLLVSNRASFEGRRGGEEGQGAGGVQVVWTGVEMWEMGDLKHQKLGTHLRARTGDRSFLVTAGIGPGSSRRY